MFGLVSVASVDCAVPWSLQVNPELSWFHFSSPLMLLLLYHTVASLWRNNVSLMSSVTVCFVVLFLLFFSMADAFHTFLQLITGEEGRGQEGMESAVGTSCDIITATTNLSDEVSAEMTAERRRELWRRAHEQPDCQDVQTI